MHFKFVLYFTQMDIDIENYVQEFITRDDSVHKNKINK